MKIINLINYLLMIRLKHIAVIYFGSVNFVLKKLLIFKCSILLILLNYNINENQSK